MSLSPTSRGWLTGGIGNKVAADEIVALLGYGVFGKTYYVDTFFGGTANDGLSWPSALSTMAAALSLAQTGDTILFRGDVREEIVGSNLKYDITIIGVGGLHHPDQPAATYDYGSATWRPPASPTAATPLLKVRGRGWKFINIFFDCPVDSAAVYLERNALSDVSEYDASHASFIGCRFVDGKYGIQDVGGCYNVTVRDCQFKAFTTAAIANTSTAVANPLNWKIENCQFPSDTSDFGNVTHIDTPLNSSVIKDNVFGKVRSTAVYIDLTLGNNNMVVGNALAGVYNTSDYIGGTGDLWLGNWVTVETQEAPNGFTILPPAAP